MGLSIDAPSAMTAVEQSAFGGPEVLRVTRVPLPQADDGQVLVRVTLCGVNFGDLTALATGDNHIARTAEPPFVPGSEVVGRRVDTGERVVGLCGLGGYAEYTTVASDRLYAIPDSVDDATALALFVAGVTAWHLVRTCGRVAPGDRVAVHAASGGVGSIAVQLAATAGAAHVVGVASTPSRRDAIYAFGASCVVSTGEDLVDKLRDAAPDGLYDVVLDCRGGAAFVDTLTLLAPFARLVLFATPAGAPPAIPPARLIAGSVSVAGFWLMDCFRRPDMVTQALSELFDLAAAGRLRAHVGERFALRDAAQAHRSLAARTSVGKIVLETGAASGDCATKGE